VRILPLIIFVVVVTVWHFVSSGTVSGAVSTVDATASADHIPTLSRFKRGGVAGCPMTRPGLALHAGGRFSIKSLPSKN
jgi:hypothetical protein